MQHLSRIICVLIGVSGFFCRFVSASTDMVPVTITPSSFYLKAPDDDGYVEISLAGTTWRKQCACVFCNPGPCDDPDPQHLTQIGAKLAVGASSTLTISSIWADGGGSVGLEVPPCYFIE